MAPHRGSEETAAAQAPMEEEPAAAGLAATPAVQEKKEENEEEMETGGQPAKRGPKDALQDAEDADRSASKRRQHAPRLDITSVRLEVQQAISPLQSQCNWLTGAVRALQKAEASLELLVLATSATAATTRAIKELLKYQLSEIAGASLECEGCWHRRSLCIVRFSSSERRDMALNVWNRSAIRLNGNIVRAKAQVPQFLRDGDGPLRAGMAGLAKAMANKNEATENDDLFVPVWGAGVVLWATSTKVALRRTATKDGAHWNLEVAPWDAETTQLSWSEVTSSILAEWERNSDVNDEEDEGDEEPPTHRYDGRRHWDRPRLNVMAMSEPTHLTEEQLKGSKGRGKGKSKDNGKGKSKDNDKGKNFGDPASPMPCPAHRQAGSKGEAGAAAPTTRDAACASGAGASASGTRPTLQLGASAKPAPRLPQAVQPPQRSLAGAGAWNIGEEEDDSWADNAWRPPANAGKGGGVFSSLQGRGLVDDWFGAMHEAPPQATYFDLGKGSAGRRPSGRHRGRGRGMKGNGGPVRYNTHIFQSRY